ncbi:MAG: hypothetical protein ACRDJT_11610 [Actinomycetota bacterium]
MNDDITLRALVVLRSRRAPIPRSVGGVTRDKHVPDRKTLEAAIEFFKRKGFAVGDVVGTSFWIESRTNRFESLFGQTLEIRRRRNLVESVRLQDGSTEFDLTLLPDEIARHVLAVTFPEPLISRWSDGESRDH